MGDTMHMNVEAPSQHIRKDSKKAGKGKKCGTMHKCEEGQWLQSTR